MSDANGAHYSASNILSFPSAVSARPLSLSLSCSLYIMTNSLTSDLLCYDPAGSGIIREEKKKEGGGGGGGGERGREEEEEEESGGEMRLVDKSVLTWQ